MLTWKEFSRARPDLAEAGRGLLYQFGVGLGFLATVATDGFPRTHAVRPVVTSDGIYLYVMPGPKLRDLRRDGKYALHCFPPIDNEDVFHITGIAKELDDGSLREAVDRTLMTESNLDELNPEHRKHPLFELLIRGVLLTRTTGHGDYHPQHTIWKA